MIDYRRLSNRHFKGLIVTVKSDETNVMPRWYYRET